MNLFTPNLQFTLNAAGPTGPVSPGAFLQTFANGDSLTTNVTFTQYYSRLNKCSFVFVTRPVANRQYQPLVTLLNGNNPATATAQFIGKIQDNGSTSCRYGVGEGDLAPYYGHNVAPSAGGTGIDYGDWGMIAGSFSGSTYDSWEILKVDGQDPSGNKGGNTASNSIDNVELNNHGIHLGWPPGYTFTGNNAFELAMVRIYNGQFELTDAQAVQIWDHWASNNQAYFENNNQTSRSYNEGVEDYTTDLLAEWDFAKMPAGILQTTAGSVGTVTGTLTGGAIVTV